MTYTIPNRSGAQTVTLYFAETYVTGAGQRLFNVSINGATVLTNFDIYASAGGANRGSQIAALDRCRLELAGGIRIRPAHEDEG